MREVPLVGSVGLPDLGYVYATGAGGIRHILTSIFDVDMVLVLQGLQLWSRAQVFLTHTLCGGI